MHHKKTVKKIFKVLFFFIQALLFISAVSLLITSITIYVKSHELLNIPLQLLMLSFLLSVLETLSATFGYASLTSKKRLKMFIYITATLMLMNTQIIMIIKSSIIHEKVQAWADKRWNVLSNDQKNFVQAKFRCCGLLNPNDRSGSVCSGVERGCMPIISVFSKNISVLVQKILVFSFFFESVSIGILSMLRLRK